MYERGQRMIHMAQNKQNQLCGAYHWQQRLKTQTYEHHKYPRHRLTGASSGRMSLVDVDVRCPVLVPFCCVHQKGPCGGPLRPEASFLRQTPSTWRTGTLLRLALAQGSLTGNPSVTPSGARLRACLREIKQSIGRKIWNNAFAAGVLLRQVWPEFIIFMIEELFNYCVLANFLCRWQILNKLLWFCMALAA